jgi:hypothetical protein
MDGDTRGSWTPPASGRRSDRVRTYREGRVCAEPGCATVLSVYNPSPRCALHQRQMAMVRFRRFGSVEAERQCRQCGAAFVTANPRRQYCSARCRSQAFAAREKAMRLTVHAGASDRQAA